jgi:hypothetical protein
MMSYASSIGRVGALAIALGIGAGVVATAGGRGRPVVGVVEFGGDP